jgi:lysophospholipase L1-like esterase
MKIHLKLDENMKQKIPTIKKILLSLIFVTLIVSILIGIVNLINYLHRREVSENHKQVKIAVFGDSIWDLVRDKSGIAEKTEEYLFDSVSIYNCSIMGSAAAELSDEETQIRPGLTYMIDALVGRRVFQAEGNSPAIQVFREIDPEQLDYIVIAYGLNDYFSAVPISSEDTFDTSTYQGALRYSIQVIQQAYPETQIILIAPTYCQLYSYGKVVADSYDQDYGGGTGETYALAAKEVAEEMEVTFVDMFHDFKINRRNGLRYLVDATHLTEKGREKYAKILGDAIISLYKKDSE